MKCRYTGPEPVHLMFRPAIDQPGEVWEVQPGDVVELPELPQLPGWEAVPTPKKGGDN